MKKLMFFSFLALMAVFAASCGSPAANNAPANAANAGNSNANANAAKPVAAAPTKEALVELEKGAWAAWQKRDGKYFETFLSDKYVAFGAEGRQDKAAAIKATTATNCEVKSYSMSDEQMYAVSPDVAVLSYKAAQDYTCDGKKGPANVWSGAVYVREGDAWRCALYAETPIADPKAPAPAKPAAPAKSDAKTEAAKPDAATEALMAAETKIWEAWKAKDGKALDAALGKDFTYVFSMGRFDRAAALKMWSTDNKCEIKSFSLTEPRSVALTADVSLLTFVGAADGTCEGQPVPTEWYAAVYKKEAAGHMPAFGISLPK